MGHYGGPLTPRPKCSLLDCVTWTLTCESPYHAIGVLISRPYRAKPRDASPNSFYGLNDSRVRINQHRPVSPGTEKTRWATWAQLYGVSLLLQ